MTKATDTRAKVLGSFDRPDYSDGQRAALLKFVPADARTLLDIGSNAGAFGEALKQRQDIEVWGVEPDCEAARQAAQRLDKVINDYFTPGNPIPDAYFDLITFNDSLEHMVDPGGALRLAKKLLKPGGRVHCCVPNLRHIDNLEHILLERDFQYEEFGIRDRTHVRFFTRKSILRLFDECDYRVVSCNGIDETWWAPKLKLRRALFRLFPEATEDMRHVQFLVIAEAR